MTDFELKWSDASIKEYVKLRFKGEGALGTIATIVCLLGFAAAAVVCVLFYFTLRQPLMLFIGGGALVVGVVFVLSLYILAGRAEKRIKDVYKDAGGLVCAVGENEIIIVKDNVPVNIIKWDNVEEINEGKTAYFVRTKDNLLIMLEKGAVISGELSEAAAVIGMRKKAISERENN